MSYTRGHSSVLTLARFIDKVPFPDQVWFEKGWPSVSPFTLLKIVFSVIFFKFSNAHIAQLVGVRSGLGPDRKTGVRRLLRQTHKRGGVEEFFTRKISVPSTDSLQELYTFWIFFRRINLNLFCARIAQLARALD